LAAYRYRILIILRNPKITLRIPGKKAVRGEYPAREAPDTPPQSTVATAKVTWGVGHPPTAA